MRLILHGILRELHGPEVYFESSNVFDALQGFCTQIGPLPQGVILEAVGYDSPEAMKASGPVDEVHLAPMMAGGGGKFTTFLIAAVEIGISFIPGIGPALALALRVAGIAAAIAGVVNLIMPAPSNTKAADPPASKYLGLNQNTTAIGTPQMIAYGEVKLAGQWLSLMSQSNSIIYGNFPT